MTPKVELGRDFCTMHGAPIPRVSSSRRRRRHPTFFATLRRWVNIQIDVYVLIMLLTLNLSSPKSDPNPRA